jgi:uncharacterized protein (DUF488 family)
LSGSDSSRRAREHAGPLSSLSGEQAGVLTIGHSTRTFEKFLELLQSYEVKQLVDIRRFPRSRRVPQFNSDVLDRSLQKSGIRYLHLEELGGRRRPKKDSVNRGWRNSSFQGYADYMQTAQFQEGTDRLLEIARLARSAILCAEALPWRCHRSLVADALVVCGVHVGHILDETTAHPHQLTAFARVEGQTITYPEGIPDGRGQFPLRFAENETDD